MSEKTKGGFSAAAFMMGAAMGVIAGVLVGGKTSLSIIITGQGSVGCTEVYPACERPCCPDGEYRYRVDRDSDPG